MILLLAILTAASITVSLPMEAEVSGTEITLGELARIEGATPAELAQLDALELGYAPAPGYSRLIFADHVAAQLRRQAPQLQVRVTGQSACRVRPRVTEIPGADIEAAARGALLRLHGGSDTHIELAAATAKVAVPAGAAAVSLRARPGTLSTSRSPLQVPVEVLVDGVVYRTVWTSWRIDVGVVVPVLLQGVRAGAELRPQLFETRRVSASELGSKKPLPATLLHGAVAARDLAPGTVVTAFDVHRSVAIQIGSHVFVNVRKGAIQARMPVVALDSGAIGDRIRVRTDGGQQLAGLVVSRELVQVDLGGGSSR